MTLRFSHSCVAGGSFITFLYEPADTIDNGFISKKSDFSNR
jgi:hypothetical protein